MLFRSVSAGADALESGTVGALEFGAGVADGVEGVGFGAVVSDGDGFPGAEALESGADASEPGTADGVLESGAAGVGFAAGALAFASGKRNAGNVKRPHAPAQRLRIVQEASFRAVAQSPATLAGIVTQSPATLQEIVAQSPATLQEIVAQSPAALQEIVTQSPAALQGIVTQRPGALAALAGTVSRATIASKDRSFSFFITSSKPVSH